MLQTFVRPFPQGYPIKTRACCASDTLWAEHLVTSGGRRGGQLDAYASVLALENRHEPADRRGLAAELRSRPPNVVSVARVYDPRTVD